MYEAYTGWRVQCVCGKQPRLTRSTSLSFEKSRECLSKTEMNKATVHFLKIYRQVLVCSGEVLGTGALKCDGYNI